MKKTFALVAFVLMLCGVQAQQAYWVFLSANQSFSIKGFPQDAPVVPVTVPQGWSMMAYPGRMAGTVMYVYKNGRFVELTGETADTTGVWIYRQ